MAGSTKARVVGGLSASALASVLAILLPWLKKNEGLSLIAYQDVAGIWTGCFGHAYVKPGQAWTKEQCDAILETDVMAHLLPVVGLLKVQLSPQTLAAHAHFAFNIGVEGYDPVRKRFTGYRGSQTLALTNAGDLAAGCRAMANWYTAGGKDCRVRSNGCYGVINRRNEEIALCLKGLE